MHPSIIAYQGTVPRAAETVFIAGNATVIGAVQIDTDASIWFGAVLRADGDTITIGAGSNVQDGCVVHTDRGFPVRIGRHVTLGHRAVVHGAVIDDDVLIGMGAVVLNGARIGKHCIVGAGAVIREGDTIPAGSLVAGVPGRVLREVTDEARKHIRGNAENYIALARTYKSMT